MNKAGLFGGGWEDYLNALNDAFDRHVAENVPPHPFGASVDAIMTGYPDGATILPSRNGTNTGAMVPLPFPNCDRSRRVSNLARPAANGPSAISSIVQ